MGRLVLILKRVSSIDALDEVATVELGEHFAIADTGHLYYKHYVDGTIKDVTGSGGGGGGSAKYGVFITDVQVITPSDAIVEKTFDSSQDNLILTSCMTNATVLRVKIVTLSTDSVYKPSVSIAGNSAILTNASPFVWTGYADVTLPGTGSVTISAAHQSGTQASIDVEALFAPIIDSSLSRFTGSYPTTSGHLQTELKENDSYTFHIQADQQFNLIDIVTDANNASKPLQFIVAPTNGSNFNIQAANLGNTAQLKGLKVRVRSVAGIWSSVFDSGLAGGGSPVEGQHVVKLNNLAPTLNVSNIAYPVSSTPIVAQQHALRHGNAAVITNTASNYDVIAYSDPVSQLTINNPNTFEGSKTVTANSFTVNVYNVNSPNFVITAKRYANGSQTVLSSIVAIADKVPTFTISRVAGRLRSGGNLGTSPQDYVITITSDQSMHPDYPLSVNSSVCGWTPASSWNRVSASVATRSLRVHDNDVKGSYNLDTASGYNLACLAVNPAITNPSIDVGGFVLRTFTLGSDLRLADFGTVAMTSSKLRCTNYSFSDSLVNYTYAAGTANVIGQYTIQNPDMISYGLGKKWRNNDDQNVVANTTYMTIDLEELA
jgi:hypothetical protein